MRNPFSPTIADCGCELCLRADALDDMRHIEAARASRVPAVADPWPARYRVDRVRFATWSVIAAVSLVWAAAAGWLLVQAVAWMLGWLT